MNPPFRGSVKNRFVGGWLGRHLDYKRSELERQDRISLTLMSYSLRRRESDTDGCYVLDLVCSSCGAAYAEEYGQARLNASKGLDVLCIQCDGSDMVESHAVPTKAGLKAMRGGRG